MEIHSSAFDEGATIPQKYTCDGPNVSPPLRWSGIPGGTKTLALICDDPDAPVGTWVHWVVWNIPAATTELAEHVPPVELMAGGAIQGKNDFRKIGYGGPCPPHGSHRYFFSLFALNTELHLKPGSTKAELLKAMDGHILAEALLMGRYQR
ncbi:YbhB/YbcL family Raf kinase inhibitor-like protein [Gaoshiqia sediminis]|uniref:YbhB/YbcL family Raf kinase inhibitor-like protein n=1 Tax=Gaoshiqia sediminis TaxID=2986998 RepID=A0AA41YAY1_9BACT|nr:YbhB/YbcL family Raf kinase inhibitor-like protein [Gaoshiqia sediminis]MCW0481287.1 YbhB/YbcL family Raf kinase inhibitor-like protein [Gaoshiqia sediminis]